MKLIYPLNIQNEFVFNSSPRDFTVEEIPLYEFTGEGEHLVLKVRKKELTTWEMIDILSGKELGTTKLISDMDESAFKEMSNILTGSFLTALSKMLNVKLLPSVPHTSTDMLQALMDFILAQVSMHADNVLCIKTRINVQGHDINGDFLILFDEPSLKRMIDILHKQFG